VLKSSRQWQTFIVNGRVIANRMLSKALDNAFHSLLPHSGFPLAVLTINLPPDEVDVNIHPQKSEVKFQNERSIYSAVYKAVAAALSQARQPLTIAATYPVERERPPAIDSFRRFEQPSLPYAFDHVCNESTSLSVVRETLASVAATTPGSAILSASEASVEPRESSLQALGQVENCYIIARGTDGLYIVDQHAAHERILYDKFQQSSDRIHAQKLLIPPILTFDPLESQSVVEAEAVLQELGFVLEPIGPDTYRLSEMPADVTVGEAQSLLREALRLLNELRDPSPAALRHAFLQMAACKAAVKAGDPLNIRQLQAILDALCSTDRPFTCPHGRPAMVRFSGDDLGKMFKRT
jgi:DNA mismatch repair protein MutL